MGGLSRKEAEVRLQKAVDKLALRPYAYVCYAFPWGKEDTVLHAHPDGPDKWQKELLLDIEKALTAGKVWNMGAEMVIDAALRIAVRSGHGVGKTALISWLIHWFCSTRPHPQIVCTANTKEQLMNKTWRELAKWNKLAINSHWFDWKQTKFTHVAEPETWFATAVPWSKERAEAFAGTHEQHVLMLFDEASAIEDIIWETAEGAMTTPGAMWCAFGNPTRNTGRFYQCFNKHRSLWLKYEVDSRTAKMADRKQVQEWIDTYGEDSDFVRVRVLGREPRAGLAQLIPTSVVEAAIDRHYDANSFTRQPRLLGVDVARFGDDRSCTIKRQGMEAWDLKKYRGLDLMAYASIIAQEINQWRPDGVFIDEVGIGAGVIDRLTQLGHGHIIIPVNGGHAAVQKDDFFNKRMEMWWRMGDWLKAGGSIPDDVELRDDLTGPEYGFSAKEQMQLEKKQDMKERGLDSPDAGDALAHTFAEHVEAQVDQLEHALGIDIHQLPVPSMYDDGSTYDPLNFFNRR